MLWPALRAHSLGELTEDQVAWLRETFGLTEGPRTEGPGAEDSIAHRSLTDEQGIGLVLDLAGLNHDGWLFTLFQTTGDKPSAAFVETQRAAFRAAIDHLGLRLLEIEPAATADEVQVISAGPDDASELAMGGYWYLPNELDLVWPHLGLLRDAPREVKEVKLRDLMRAPAWQAVPEEVRRQAQEFLDGH